MGGIARTVADIGGATGESAAINSVHADLFIWVSQELLGAGRALPGKDRSTAQK